MRKWAGGWHARVTHVLKPVVRIMFPLSASPNPNLLGVPTPFPRSATSTPTQADDAGAFGSKLHAIASRAEYDKLTRESQGLVVVDFYAP